jgi:hypothetical protein
MHLFTILLLAVPIVHVLLLIHVVLIVVLVHLLIIQLLLLRAPLAHLLLSSCTVRSHLLLLLHHLNH